MSRRRLLDDDQADALYAEYCLWLSLAPKKLKAKYGISDTVFTWYARRKHKTRRAA